MIKRSIPRTSQPQYPAKVSKSNPLAKGLVEVFNPLSIANPTSIRGHIPSQSASGISDAVGVFGRCIDITPATNSGLIIANNSNDLFPSSTDVTICVIRRSKDTAARNSTLFGNANDAVDRVLCHAPYSDGNLYWDFGSNDVANRISVAFTKSTSVDYLVFVAGGGKGREVWRNRVKIAGDATKTGARPNSASNFRLGGAGGATAQDSDSEEVYLFAVANRAWSDAEIASWFSNPWQIFEPRKQNIYVAAATGGTTTLITASDIFTFSLTEVFALLSRSDTSDAVTPSLVESQVSLLTSDLAESLTPTLTEANAVMAGLVAADTLTPSVTELAAVIAAFLVSEVFAPTLTESQSSLLFSSLSETFTPTLTESQSSLLSSSLSDTLTPSITDTSLVAVLLSVLDTLTPSVTELSEVIAALSLVDSLTPSVTESQSSLLFSVLSEIFAPSLTESQSSLLLSNPTDLLTPSISDSALAAAVAAATLSQLDIDAIANAIWSKVIESGMSSADILRIILSAVSGKTAGIGTSTEKYKSADELKDRIRVTFDADNNRTSVTRDGT